MRTALRSWQVMVDIGMTYLAATISQPFVKKEARCSLSFFLSLVLSSFVISDRLFPPIYLFCFCSFFLPSLLCFKFNYFPF
jgi:hypothetical protein